LLRLPAKTIKEMLAKFLLCYCRSFINREFDGARRRTRDESNKFCLSFCERGTVHLWLFGMWSVNGRLWFDWSSLEKVLKRILRGSASNFPEKSWRDAQTSWSTLEEKSQPVLIQCMHWFFPLKFDLLFKLILPFNALSDGHAKKRMNNNEKKLKLISYASFSLNSEGN
jgi:hypothetical protein